MSDWDEYGQYYSQPVSKDGFFYGGNGFYVEIDRHRHERLDSGSLYRLLTYTEPPPVLTKAGKVAKRQPPPHKDSPDHFYYAQLKHYGLKAWKTKPAAKKYLLAAFDATTESIPVPKHILELENSLKEEYRLANIAAAKKYKEEQEQRKIEEEIQQKKKNEEYDAILNEFAAVGVVIRRDAIRGSDEYEIDDDEESKAHVSDTQLRKDIATFPESHLRDLVSEYKIIAPYLQDQWSGDTGGDIHLKMSPSLNHSHLWVWFHFGVVSGIMRSRGPPPEKVGDVVHFLWRGREEGEGEMTYGEDNIGSITFLGDGKIRGTMRWMGEFEFAGKKVPRRNVVWVKSVDGWKNEWRGINIRSYESARVGRWGGGWYQGDDSGYATPNSDTDPGKGSEDEEDDRYEYDEMDATPL
ncbi:hypothetical protein Hypma_013077 [Hypsizygus marmoreus]|uniref:Uncharacterized protein n=1 Tax=Hypsizygus marmoreus TaxID=39966 RepID=A0A369JD08_HYPMA|nr:hypothetical protein Hypma_013077 [Hypsizygus marmoreus]